MASPLPPDPYLVLVVPRDASAATIKTRYHKLVFQHHPDKIRAEEDSEQEAVVDYFIKIQKAWEILGDENKRERHDAQCRLQELRKEVMARQPVASKDDRAGVRSARSGTSRRGVAGSSARATRCSGTLGSPFTSGTSSDESSEDHAQNATSSGPPHASSDKSFEIDAPHMTPPETPPNGVDSPGLATPAFALVPAGEKPTAPLHEDSGYESASCTQSSKLRYPGLVLQPDSSPISQDQLAAEVKGIYAGLVMVEAKCINIDAAQAADPSSQLGQEQWWALVALHRTLLYEHHDFLMASQHPSATPALRGLASKYSMPARMWKHGIHAFLEVLRHQRPASQYMQAFIYLAYQMIALLYETVPAFNDTWTECLGDLARCHMAIDDEQKRDEKEGDAQIGRLKYHLETLERPRLCNFGAATRYTKAADSHDPLEHAPSKSKGEHVDEITEGTILRTAEIVREADVPPSLTADAITGETYRAHVNSVRDRHTQRYQPVLLYEPEVLGRLDGIEQSCLPDKGASTNVLSQRYVQRRGIKYDPVARFSIKLAQGRRATVIGTVNLPFSYIGETEVHHLDFYVLAHCIRDVILGSPFLRLTQTFERFAHRVSRKLRDIKHTCVRYSGSSERMVGSLDGLTVKALPDTGSDVMLLSAKYARQRGFVVNEDSMQQIDLRFADGSVGRTSGLVEGLEWAYTTNDASKYLCDFYVLEDLECDVLLSYDFLWQTDAFSEYGNWMSTTDEDVAACYNNEDWTLSTITRVMQTVEQLATVTVPELESVQARLLQQLGAIDEDVENDRIRGRIGVKRRARKDALNTWHRDWDGLQRAWERAKRRLLQSQNASHEDIDNERRRGMLIEEEAIQRRQDFDAMWAQGWARLYGAKPALPGSAMVSLSRLRQCLYQ
ncbi:hypothetical protein LTR85_007660 [Meristemomyces frigidus]|nr:hypothetical protein LTR85_007660 [Meristemomyces frigidus]